MKINLNKQFGIWIADREYQVFVFDDNTKPEHVWKA